LTITNRIKSAVRGFTAPTTKNAALGEARAFLKYGNQRNMTADWSQVLMSDEDNYTGFLYGALDIRAVSATKIGEYYVKTTANFKTLQEAKKKEEVITHPYYDLINNSTNFSNFDFWYDNVTYVDLKGVSYVMAIRTIGTNGVLGRVQEFKLLNPFQVQRIFDSKGELQGYREYRGGMVRDIPKELIIPIINLNPFDQTKLWSLADAAKDNQFTLKTANDYTRLSIRNNVNAPGIISTDRELEGEDLKNFRARVMGHEKGEPLFGGGAGAIKWEDMQSDLNKAALDKVNSISINSLIAVTGASKTMLGIEESGTTRDTSTTQKDNFIEYRTMPAVQKIVDALNLDYQRNYSADYDRWGYKMFIDNPLGSDHDAELKDIEIRDKKEELYLDLVNKGYDREVAAKYTEGEITLIELGEPTNEPKTTETPENQATILLKQNKKEHVCETNALTPDSEGEIQNVQASLQNSIINLDERLLADVANKIGQVKNDFDSEDDIIAERKKQEYISELTLLLVGFYGIIIPLVASNVLSKRAASGGGLVAFTMNNEVRTYIKTTAGKAALSHITTTVDSMYKYAQQQALAGQPRDVIARNIINKYGAEISKSRAVTIARTEANRAFTMSQYMADKQFLKSEGLTERAYKQWVTRNDNPCAFCQELASQPPIPFVENFADIGDELTGTEERDGKTVVKKMTVTYADLEAGNAHPNCGCTYTLVDENGNQLT